MAQRLLMNMDQMDIARSIPLFAGLSIQEREIFLQGGGVFSYPCKKSLFHTGDRVNFIYILCSGTVQEFRETLDGHEVTFNIYKAGDMFCKTELFLEDSPHLTSARAADEVHVLELPIGPFKENLQKYAPVRNHLILSLAQLAAMKQVEVEQQITLTSTEILATFLRQLCSTYGLDPRGFTLPYKKSLLASRLGMELETLSRALPKLKAHGIQVKGPHVCFLDSLSSAPNVVKLFPSPANMRRWTNGDKSYGSSM